MYSPVVMYSLEELCSEVLEAGFHLPAARQVEDEAGVNHIWVEHLRENISVSTRGKCVIQ
jgi:hypothetical protein